MGVKEEKSRARTYVFETLVSILMILAASFPHRALFFASDVLNSFVDQTDYNLNYNQYLKGDFAPVAKEHTSIKLVPTSGSLPADLAGLFVRIGPNPMVGAVHSSRGHMLFDGDGMIHSIRIKEKGKGEAEYSNAWVQTPNFVHSKWWDRPVGIKVGELIHSSGIGLLKAVVLGPLINLLFGMNALTIGVANTNVFVYDDKIYCGHEASLPFEIQWHRDNSFTSAGFASPGSLGAQLDYPVNAHPKVDPVSNKLYFSGYSITDEHELKVGVYDGPELSSYYGLDLPVKSWVHDTLMTENYLLLVESSVTFSGVDGILRGVLFDFNSTHRFRVGVVPKSASSSAEARNSTTWFEAEAPLTFVHGMNAWESGNVITIVTPLAKAFDGSLTEANVFTLHHITLDLSTGLMKVVEKNKDGDIVEFPRMHPGCLTLPAKFGYAITLLPGTGVLDIDGIVKYNQKTGKEVARIRLEPGVLGGEAVPMPKARTALQRRLADTSAAAGNLTIAERREACAGALSGQVYLGMFVFDTGSNISEWRVYDGESMASKPLARLALPDSIRVPYGFHGEWIPADVLERHFKRHNA